MQKVEGAEELLLHAQVQTRRIETRALPILMRHPAYALDCSELSSHNHSQAQGSRVRGLCTDLAVPHLCIVQNKLVLDPILFVAHSRNKLARGVLLQQVFNDGACIKGHEMLVVLETTVSDRLDH